MEGSADRHFNMSAINFTNMENETVSMKLQLLMCNMELVMSCFLVGPVAVIEALLALYIMVYITFFFLREFINWLFKRVYKLLGCDEYDSQFGITMKLLLKTVTHNLLHPEVILNKAIKKILLKWMNVSKDGNDRTALCQHPDDSSNGEDMKTTEVVTIKEEKAKDGPKLQTDTEYWVSTITLGYYATLFTGYFWPRIIYAVLYGASFDGPSIVFIICIAISYAIFCPNFIDYVSAQNTIPTDNQLSETEALTYLTGPLACNAYVKMKYVQSYNLESSGESYSQVTRDSKDINIPVTKWTDTTAPPCKDIFSADLSKLLSKTPFFLVSAVLKAEPADEESKQYLDQFKQTYIEQNRYRDQEICALFSYKLMKNGKDVDELVVFRDGASVPKYLLGREYFCLAFIAVVPLPALLLLTWKLVRRKIIFKKTIQTSMTEPRSNSSLP